MSVVGYVLFGAGSFATAWGAFGIFDRHTYSPDDRDLFVLGVIGMIGGVFVVSAT